jgi:formylglycine-generating enzyme required for sulfatase activity
MRLGQTSFGGNGTNRPATGVTWNEAARFVNWMNTSTGGFATYKFTTLGVNDDIALWDPSDTLDYDPNNLYRSKRATYVLPSYNEWYKAAYYDPNKPGGPGYWDFPTGSDTAPTPVASGTAANTAVYLQPVFQGPADVNQAGGLSPYGVMGLGGNVIEWEESSVDLANGSVSSPRGIRGTVWNGPTNDLSSSARYSSVPSGLNSTLNGGSFRVTSLSPQIEPIPEPSMMMIMLCGVGGYIAKRRFKKLSRIVPI